MLLHVFNFSLFYIVVRSFTVYVEVAVEGINLIRSLVS